MTKFIVIHENFCDEPRVIGVMRSRKSAAELVKEELIDAIDNRWELTDELNPLESWNAGHGMMVEVHEASMDLNWRIFQITFDEDL